MTISKPTTIQHYNMYRNSNAAARQPKILNKQYQILVSQELDQISIHLLTWLDLTAHAWLTYRIIMHVYGPIAIKSRPATRHGYESSDWHAYLYKYIYISGMGYNL